MKTKYILFILVLISTTQFSIATTYTWTGSVDTVFTNSNNWTQIPYTPSTYPGYPVSSDTAIIVSATNRPVLSSNHDVYRLVVTSGSFDLKGYTFTSTGSGLFSGGAIDNGSLVVRGTKIVFVGTVFNTTVEVEGDDIDLGGGVFNKDCIFSTTGQQHSNGYGGCVFNADVTIIHNGNNGKYWRLETVHGDEFNGKLVLINRSNGMLVIAETDTTQFNGNLELNNIGGGLIYFGYKDGYSELAAGKTISVGDSGFYSGELYFERFTQTGSIGQTLILTDSSKIFMKNCIFEGACTITSPEILCNKSTFLSATTITKTGKDKNYWGGENSFEGPVTIANQYTGSDGSALRLADSPNYYHDDVVFESSGEPIEVVKYSSSEFGGNISINNTAISFRDGLTELNAKHDQYLNGTTIFDFEELIINKDIHSVILNTPIEINSGVEFIAGYIVSDSTNLITFLAGSKANGAHNGSFVSGPVKKVGDEAFEFPVGKGDWFGPVQISSPDSSTAIFVAEYFNSDQQAGNLIDSTIFQLSVSDYWKVNQVFGIDTIQLTFNWNKQLNNIGIDSSDLRISYWNDTIWNSVLTDTLIANETIIYLRTQSLNNYGLFVVANASAGKFSGIINGGKEVQTWGISNSYVHGNCTFLSSPSKVYSNSTSISNYCGVVPPPVLLSEVKKLSIGPKNGLAILCDMTIASWGDNLYHQVGNPEPLMNTPGSTFSGAAVPVIRNNNILSNITSISTGYFASLALNSDGNIYYWGADITEVADASISVANLSGSSNPEIVQYSNTGPNVEEVISISAGTAHFLALLRDGTVFAWGRNNEGQIGNGTTGVPAIKGENHPIQVKINATTYLEDIIAISAGDRHSMALDVQGRVWCWGYNVDGQLGNGTTTSSNYAIQLTSLNNITGISAGANHSIAFNNGQAYAWGNNVFNQCGQAQGSNVIITTPTAVLLPGGIADIHNISCGYSHNLLTTIDGRLYAWGNGYDGELAILPTLLPLTNIPQYTSPPIEISNLQNNAHPLEPVYLKCDERINYCFYNLEIDASTNWPLNLPNCVFNDPFLIENELLISKGCTLTLDNLAILGFGPNGRIVLEEGDGTDAGAQLIINDGAILTAASDCMWKGIEVRGSAAHNATNSRQAKVIINSGAIIEHAHNAVTLGKLDDGYYACFESLPISFASGFDFSGSGGQLECDDATFQNNAIDIRFAPYPKLSSSFIIDSHFLGGTVRDDRYLTGSPNNPFYAPPNSLQRSYYGINQWQSKIVLIQGNGFDDYEEALIFTDSRLSVFDNQFTNSRIGINSLTTGAVLVYGGPVEGNEFNNVRTHIRASGGKYLQITNQNQFNPLVGTQQDNLFGIFLNQERAFRIQDNHFTRLRHGIVSTNSGFSGGQINYLGQGNIFNECWRSIHLEQNHRNLHIKCNTFTNPDNNLYSTNWNLISGTILTNQGWPSLTTDKSQAGNTFSQWPDRNEISSASSNFFTYFRHGNDPANSLDPYRFVIPTPIGAITVNDNSIDLTDLSDACEPVIVPTGGEPDRMAYFTSVLDSLALEMDTLIGSLDNNITDSLLNIIHPMYALDTIMIRLTGNLPLSDTVLIKAIDSPGALNDSALYEVLFMNSPYSNDVLEALNGRDPEFSEELRYELNLLQGLNPPYLTVTGLQKEIHYYQTDKQLLINDYVSRLVADDSTQKAISILESENSFEHLQTIFGTYLVTGELDSAEIKFEALMNHPDPEEDWLELHEIHLDLATETKSWFNMDSTQEAIIRYIATQEGNTLAKVQAQNVLHLVYRDTFPDYIDEEEYYLRQQQPPINLITPKRRSGINQLVIIPNPANDFITVGLKSGKQKSYNLEIIDVTGKQQYYSMMEFKQNSYGMNVSFLNSGLYLVRVTDNLGFNESTKIMIAR